MTTTTDTGPVVDWIDQTLRIIEQVRTEKHRDPLRAVENVLLELRYAVEEV